MSNEFTYAIVREQDGFYAKFPMGELVGPYVDEKSLEREMEKLRQHLAAGSFAGAR